MRQAGTMQSSIASSSQRLSLASPALRPGRGHRRPAVTTRAFFDKIFKQDPSEKTRKQYQERVDAINALEPYMQSLSDDQLRAKTQEFKQRVARGETLEALLPEAFAVSTSGRGCALLLHNCTTAARPDASTRALLEGRRGNYKIYSLQLCVICTVGPLCTVWTYSGVS